MRPQLMSVMWSRPSRPLRSTKAPKSVRFLTVPLRISPGHHFREQLGATLVAFLLDQLPARQHDVLPFLVDLDDLEPVHVAQKTGEIARRNDVDLRGRQEGLDTDVDEQAAFDDGLDLAFDRAPFVADRENSLPVLLELRFLAGQDHHALAVFEPFNEHVNLVADLGGLGILELGKRDDAFALVADVDEDFLGADFEDDAFDDLAWDKALGALPQGFFHGEHRDRVVRVRQCCGRLGRESETRRRLHCLTDHTLQWQRRLKSG